MKQRIKKGLPAALSVIIILTIGMFWFDQINYYLYYYSSGDGKVECWEGDNVALIRVQGEIVTYDNWYGYTEGYEDDIVSSDRIVSYIQNADERDHIKAIIIEIDSYGGLAVAAEEIMNAIRRVNKPTVAVIRESGLSAGYLVATGADYIFASEMSDVGSIGITMSYLDYSEQNRREGVIYQELSSGKFKDVGNKDKNLTQEERDLLMRDITESHNLFVRKVAENRGMEVEEVEKLADGSSMLGKRQKIMD